MRRATYLNRFIHKHVPLFRLKALERKLSRNFRSNPNSISRFYMQYITKVRVPTELCAKGMQYFSELFSIHLIDVSTTVVALCKKGVALNANYSMICTLLKFRHFYKSFYFYENTRAL